MLTSNVPSNVPSTVTVATVAPIAPVTVTRPAPKAVKPSKAAPVAVKPAKPAKPDSTAREAAISKLRGIVAATYNGPSLSVRSTLRLAASSIYSELLANPKHRTTIAKLTVRDESALRLIASNLKSGSFDPSAINLDRGNFSRLASVGYIVATATGFGLSKAGATAAALLAKRQRAA